MRHPKYVGPGASRMSKLDSNSSLLITTALRVHPTQETKAEQ